MTNREKGKQLELWVLSHFSEDRLARLSRGSGNGNDIGDVVTSDYFFECKNWNKDCVTLSMRTWNHLINQLPINTNKTPIYVYQNKKGKKFIIMDAEDFFRRIK